MKILRITALIVCLLTIQLTAQNTKHSIVTGKIVYKITVSSQTPSKAGQHAPEQMTLYFSPTKTRSEMKMPTGNAIVMISDFLNGTAYTLMDMGPKKMAIQTTFDEIKAKRKGPAPKVTLTRESKVIAGYTCYKAIVIVTNDKGDHTMDVWFSNEIKSQNTFSTKIEGINGCLMEFETSEGGRTMTMTAESVQAIDNIDPALFTVPEGYTITKASDMMKR